MGCHSLLQGIFLTQGLNPGLVHCSWILNHLNHQGSTSVEIPSVGDWLNYDQVIQRNAIIVVCTGLTELFPRIHFTSDSELELVQEALVGALEVGMNGTISLFRTLGWNKVTDSAALVASSQPSLFALCLAFPPDWCFPADPQRAQLPVSFLFCGLVLAAGPAWLLRLTIWWPVYKDNSVFQIFTSPDPPILV